MSIEDPFNQEDWKAWKSITAATTIQIVGDDLTVTNPKRIQIAVDEEACNCLLLKVSFIETCLKTNEINFSFLKKNHILG